MKVIFMGTPDFAVPCLRALCEAGYDVPCVVCQPDKPVGRRMVLTPCAVKKAALELGLNVYQPTTLRSGEALEALSSFAPDFIVVAAYGKILPPAVLALPTSGPVNVHGSLLPLYRGASPIQSAVLAGDKVTGITTMLMDEGMDTGDILMTLTTPIGAQETAGELFDRLALLAPPLLLKTLTALCDGSAVRVRQDGSKATFTHMIKKEDALIDWSLDAQRVHDLIRGMDPWPVAFTFFEGRRMKVYGSRVLDERTDRPCGTVKAVDGRLTVVCGGGTEIELMEVCPEGGRRMPSSEFLKGHSVDIFTQ